MLAAGMLSAGGLFLLGAWLSVRLWRVMAGSWRLAVRVGADLVLSLLLGLDIVVFLVWSANLLDLRAAEVTVLRGTLEWVGSVAALPWQLWAGIYGILAGISLVSVLWIESPLVLRRSWLEKYPLVPSINLSRRLLNGAHISLLVTALIGLAGPVSLEPVLRDQIREKYTLTFQGDLESRAEFAAYEEIRRHFEGHAGIVASRQLSMMVARVGKVANSGFDQVEDVGRFEYDIALHLGQAQVKSLRINSTQSALSGSQFSASLAPFIAPVRDPTDLAGRLEMLDRKQRNNELDRSMADRAAELAASAIATTIQVPDLGHKEIVGIIKGYLVGIVEGGPLKEVFKAWILRIAGVALPPKVDVLITPDPKKLEEAVIGNRADPAAADNLMNDAVGAVAEDVRYQQGASFAGEEAWVRDGCCFHNDRRYVYRFDPPAPPELPADPRVPAGHGAPGERGASPERGVPAKRGAPAEPHVFIPFW